MITLPEKGTKKRFLRNDESWQRTNRAGSRSLGSEKFQSQRSLNFEVLKVLLSWDGWGVEDQPQYQWSSLIGRQQIK